MTALLTPVYRREPRRISKCLSLHILGSYFKNWFEVRAVGGMREEDISKKKKNGVLEWFSFHTSSHANECVWNFRYDLSLHC